MWSWVFPGCSAFFKDWLVDHIMVSDQDYAKFSHAMSQSSTSFLSRFFSGFLGKIDRLKDAGKNRKPLGAINPAAFLFSVIARLCQPEKQACLNQKDCIRLTNCPIRSNASCASGRIGSNKCQTCNISGQVSSSAIVPASRALFT